MEPKVDKRNCHHCQGLGFYMGREPEEGEPFQNNCAWCNGFGILLRRDGGKWEKIKSLLETLQVGPA